jgi:catechol 2,3-dioxygenase-like lactoylglutathione lyase family enzyme
MSQKEEIVLRANIHPFNRRQAVAILSAAGGWAARGLAGVAPLPLETSGLEHIGMTVPDQEATARFYGAIFDPQLFQERDPPPRFYVRLGTSYIAFGGFNASAQNPQPRIDHFCALVQNYNPQEMRKALDEAGIPMGQGPGGMAGDPDGLRLQLLGVPGGLAKTIIPATRISQEEPAVEAIGFEHIVLAVSDLEKSAAHYRKFFGMEQSRSRKPERIWFRAARTRLGLEMAAPGGTPQVDHICIKVAGFDKRRITERLKALKVEVIASNDEGLLRFRDPHGLIMELKAGE